MTAATPTAERPSRLYEIRRFFVEHPEVLLIILFVGILVLRDVISADANAFTQRSLTTMFLFAAPLGLLAAGQTLVMLTAGVDLSVATTATASAYIMAAYGTKGTATAILIGLGVGLLVGLINGVGVGIFGVQPLIMTLGIASITIGFLTVAAQTIFKHAPLVPEIVTTLGSERFLREWVPYSLLVWAPIAALIIFGLRSSGFGRALYAVGDNPVACRLAGIRVWQVLLAVYALCGVLSAIAGILLVGYTDAADLGLATPYLLPSVAAVVIGGTSIFGGFGGYTGTILGALILTALDSLLTDLDARQAHKQMLYGGIILALAWLYSQLSRES